MFQSDHPMVAADARAGELEQLWGRVVGRRSFLRNIGLATAAALPAAGAVSAGVALAAGNAPTKGDIAILRFLAAAEILESDLWSQYAELGGVNGGNPAYMAALQNLDMDMPQYIADNTDDELSHAAFINAYLVAKGAKPVSLERFRTLDGSHATGSTGKKRLTNLKQLNVDTSYYTRYRSGQNPDLGATFPQAVTIKNQPAIPVNDADTPPNMQAPVPPTTPQQQRMQAIANSAGFHFAMIEQGGSSLYSTMSLKVSSLEVLRIVVSIGGVETNHFSLWHDKCGNAVSQPLAGVTDPQTGTHFPDLNAPHSELAQTNLILPEPTQFLSRSLPVCSVVRPTSDALAGARAAVKGLTRTGCSTGSRPPSSASSCSSQMQLTRLSATCAEPPATPRRDRSTMTGFLSPTHILLLLVVVLLLSGAKRLPEFGRSLGSSMREFKHSLDHEQHDGTPQVAAAAATEPEAKNTRQPVPTADP